LQYNDVWNNKYNYMTGTPGINDISADPMFLDAVNHDYSLLAGSPCIDAGDPDPQYFDPDGSRADMGAQATLKGTQPWVLITFAGQMSGSRVPSLTPDIRWTITDDTGAPQTDYEVEVGTDADWSTAELWATGPVSSSVNHIVYAGLPLINRTTYWCRVRVSNGTQWGDWTVVSFMTYAPFTIRVPAMYPTISQAITVATDGDSVVVDPGIYTGPITLSGKSIYLVASGGPAVTRIEGSSEGTTLTVTGGNTDQSVIEGFTFHGGNIAIQTSNSAVTIRHNVLADQTYCCWAAMIIQGPSRIIGNTIVGAANGGLACYSSGAVIKNNIIAFNYHYGVVVSGFSPSLSYNDVYGNPSNYNDLLDPGPPSISVDPEFVDRWGGDYSLQPSSPCIDAGDPDPIYNDPDNSRADMGALPVSIAPSTLPMAKKFSIVGLTSQFAVSTLTPQFYWSFYDNPASLQAAYEIQIGTDNDWTTAEIWATGSVMSADTVVTYSGPPLTNRKTYYARCRVSNGTLWGGWALKVFTPVLPYTLHVPEAYPTISAAVGAATDGDSVVVSPGTYADQINLSGKSIFLTSTGGPAVTTIEGSSYSTTLTVSGSATDNSVIEGFTFHGGLNAILTNSSAATIRYNVLADQTNCCWAAMIIQGPSRVINNTVVGAANGGIACYSSNAVIKNNIIAFNHHYGLVTGGVSSILHYNDVFGNPSNYKDVPDPGFPSISADPLFTDRASHDYSLLSTSPCIDAGDPSTMYNDPDGSRADMGALPTGIIPPVLPVAKQFGIVGLTTKRTVPNLTPTFYWTYYDNPVSTQTAYELEIGTDNNWTTVEIWASGTVTSADTQMVYAGPPLGDRKTYFARCRVSNGSSWGSWSIVWFITKVARHVNVPEQAFTFQSAIDMAEDGDSILVSPGGYLEHATVAGKTVYFVATGGSSVTQFKWDGIGGSPVSFSGTTGGSFVGFNWLPANYGSSAAISCASGNFDISDNLFDHLKAASIIAASGSGKITVKRNVFAAPTCTGPVLSLTGLTATVINNTLDSAGQGLYIPKAGSVVENNIFSRCEQYALSAGNMSITEQYNCWWQNAVDRFDAPIHSTDLQVDPLFWDPPSGDYRLLRGSPCIDAGNPDIAFNDTDGSRNDIGALSANYNNALPYVTDVHIAGENRFRVIGHSPTFVWSYVSPSHSAQQEFQIQINRQNFFTEPDVWDDGPKPGADTQITFYSGSLLNGRNYYLRVRVRDELGWSDWKQWMFHMNTVPTEPALISPVDVSTNSLPTLTIQNSTDYEGDALTYDFEIYVDSLLTRRIRLYADIPQSDVTQVKLETALPDNRRYWWRVRATDGWEKTNWTYAKRFWVDSGPDAPWAVTPIYPDDAINGPIFTPTPRFIWNKGFDADPIDHLTYRFQLAITPNFAFSFTYDDLTDTTLQLADSLPENTHFWWRVYAIDSYGLVSATAPARDFWTWYVGDVDGSHNVDIADLTRLIDFLFISGTPLVPLAAGDVDGDCKVDISDLTRLIDHLFINMSPLVKGCAASGSAMASGTTRPAGRLVFPKVSAVNDDRRATDGER
ncbi:MAG: right-handed parallel beta-helix repeat-containing protein, partial [candidate division Zixibacteria bacterium]|nr:right-handed parallel beta-helix repeat-containing protein [candidate division Zixibacteria bacterium]